MRDGAPMPRPLRQCFSVKEKTCFIIVLVYTILVQYVRLVLDALVDTSPSNSNSKTCP